MQFCAIELVDQALPDCDRDVLGSGDLVQEFRDLFVEEAVVHGVEHFAVHDFFELFEIDDEAGARIDFAFHRDFKSVVVAVAVRVIAFAEDATVFLRSEIRVVIEVRCGEFSFAREIDHKIDGQLSVASRQWAPFVGIGAALPRDATVSVRPRRAQQEI